jgi:2-phosphoglycerate kinase
LALLGWRARPRLDGPVRDVRVVLVGGTSNVGKSTLAQALAARLGWRCMSTDKLGRHPGRPWRTDDRPIPEHVAAHYASLSIADLTSEQVSHYERMWPVMTSLIDAHTSGQCAGRLILEGSGVWPDRVAEVLSAEVAAVWLTASPATLRGRIYSASRYAELPDDEKVLIDHFVGRTERYNELMLTAVGRLDFALIDVDSTSSVDELVERCLRSLGQ